MIACFWFRELAIVAERKRLPNLLGEPFAVASADGILLIASEEAAKLGVQAGQSATSARALCQGLIVLPYDEKAYLDAAEPLWEALAVESSFVEPAGPEICFVDFSGADPLPPVQRLAASIAESAQMHIHCGVGAAKLIAERAARSPQDGDLVTVVDASSEAWFLSTVRLAHTSLDSKIISDLSRLSIETIGDLRKIPSAELNRKFKRYAHKLERICRGIDDDPVRPVWPPPRIESYFAFEDETSLEEPIRAALMQCCQDVSRELLQSQNYCRSAWLTVQVANSSYLRETEPLTCPTRDADGLFRACIRLLKRLHLEEPILEVRLTASDLGTGSGVQLALLDDNDSARGYPHERKRNLEAALRHLRRKFGHGALISGALMRQARRVGFWTHYLTKLRNEEVRVATDSGGKPVRYWRAKKRGKRNLVVDEYKVESIIDSWNAGSWQYGEVTEAECFRVTTNPDGQSELHHLDVNSNEWRLHAVMD